jgi:hypothetical protein
MERPRLQVAGRVDLPDLPECRARAGCSGLEFTLTEWLLKKPQPQPSHLPGAGARRAGSAAIGLAAAPGGASIETDRLDAIAISSSKVQIEVPARQRTARLGTVGLAALSARHSAVCGTPMWGVIRLRPRVTHDVAVMGIDDRSFGVAARLNVADDRISCSTRNLQNRSEEEDPQHRLFNQRFLETLSFRACFSREQMENPENTRRTGTYVGLLSRER